MKAYQCSKCKHLNDYDEYCNCTFIGADMRPNHRSKETLKECKENFEELPKEERWHEKFSWEK